MIRNAGLDEVVDLEVDGGIGPNTIAMSSLYFINGRNTLVFTDVPSSRNVITASSNVGHASPDTYALASPRNKTVFNCAPA